MNAVGSAATPDVLVGIDKFDVVRFGDVLFVVLKSAPCCIGLIPAYRPHRKTIMGSVSATPACRLTKPMIVSGGARGGRRPTGQLVPFSLFSDCCSQSM